MHILVLLMIAVTAAALGVRPVTCYQVIDGRLREVQALPVGGAA